MTADNHVGGPSPIQLSAEQETAAKEWAADDWLWTTQETVEFNLRIFARKILALASRPESPVLDDKRCPQCGRPLVYRCRYGHVLMVYSPASRTWSIQEQASRSSAPTEAPSVRKLQQRAMGLRLDDVLTSFKFGAKSEVMEQLHRFELLAALQIRVFELEKALASPGPTPTEEKA